MDLEQVKQFIEENKEDEQVQEYLKGFNSISEDDIKAYLEKEEGQKLIQPKLDSYFTKGLETWKQNNLQKLVNEELKKHNPDLTDEQKRIKELEDYVAQKEKEALFQTNKNMALNYLNEKKLPSSLVDYFVAEDENSTLENLGKFEEVFTNQLQEAVKERLKADGTELKDTNSKTTFTKEQIEAMSQEEINENWDDIKDIIGNQ